MELHVQQNKKKGTNLKFRESQKHALQITLGWHPPFPRVRGGIRISSNYCCLEFQRPFGDTFGKIRLLLPRDTHAYTFFFSSFFCFGVKWYFFPLYLYLLARQRKKNAGVYTFAVLFHLVTDLVVSADSVSRRWLHTKSLPCLILLKLQFFFLLPLYLSVTIICYGFISPRSSSALNPLCRCI